MTISNAGATGVSAVTGARGTTSTTVAYQGVAAGRIGVITACVKPSTATFPSTVTDGAGKVWDKVTDATGGTGATGLDVGQSRIAKYIRVLDGAETGSVTVTPGSSPSQCVAVMDTYAGTLGSWISPIGATGSDATHGTNPSAATAALAAALAVGDWVHAGFASDTDATSAASAHVISQTSTTFSARTARSRLGNSDGNDGAVFTWDASVTAGGAATAITLGFTSADSSCGPVAALRLREATPAALTQTVVDPFTGTTIDAGAWDNWGLAQVTQNNVLILTSTTAANYFGIQRLATVDIAAQFIGVRLISAGNQALASFNAYPIAIQFSTDNDAYWTVNGGFVRFFTQVAATQVQRVVFPYLSDTHRYFGIGFVAGNLTAIWSKDGTNWVTEYSVANLWAGDTIGVPYIMIGTDSAEGSTTTLQVDDYSTFSSVVGVAATGRVAAAGTAGTSAVKVIAAAGRCSAVAASRAAGARVASATGRTAAAVTAAAAAVRRAPATGSAPAAASSRATGVRLAPATAAVVGAATASAAASASAARAATGRCAAVGSVRVIAARRAAAAGTDAAAVTATVASVHRTATTSRSSAGAAARSAAVRITRAIGRASATATIAAAAARRAAAVGSAMAAATIQAIYGAAPRMVTGNCSASATATVTSVHRAPTSARASAAGAARAAAGKRNPTTSSATAAPTARVSAGRRTPVIARCTAAGHITAAAVHPGAAINATGRVTGAATISVTHSRLTYRPNTGSTARPDVGITGRPATGVTVRPFAGVTPRP